MSSTCSQTRSSIDLGVSEVHSSLERLQADHSPRIHPARLQHSPSLPNIWFPPHSGPIPREMTTNNAHHFQRSSTPPLSSPNDVSPAESSSGEQRPRHIKYASIDPTFRKTSTLPKTHARRRTERDQPHALLTPPLTPSSSIRTTASRDSAASAAGAGVQEGCDLDGVEFKEEIYDTDLDSTRFLMIGNVNRQISLEILESIVVNALNPTRASSDTTLTSAGTTPTSRHLDSPIRGVHPRYLESEGIVPFAFFDIRHAIAAKDIICTRSTGPLELCVGDDMDDDGQRMWLTCRFVTSDELSEIIGNSKFIESSDGAFDLIVQKIYHQVDPKDVDSEQSMEMTETTNSKTSDTETFRGGINIALLHKILKSFGGVRSFVFNRQNIDNQDSVLVYRVEYYDLREADVAYQELNNQAMFGMKIDVSGRPVKEIRDSDIPFPSVTTGKSFDGLPIGPAGSQSLMRIPFFQTGSPKPSVSLLTSPQVVPNQGSSPPYFYSSFRGMSGLVPFDHEAGPSGLHGRSGNHGTMESRVLERHQSNVFQEGNAVYRPDSISPCYTPDGICLYCPSRGSSVAVPINPGYYGLPSPTPIPALYYPPHNLAQPMTNVAQSWALTPVPYIRDDYITANHQYYPSTADQHMIQQTSHAVAHPPVPTIPPQNSIYVSTRQSSPSSHESASSPSQLKMGTSMNNIPSGVSDRNQLNLARIEDGQDTRTTVMIKNIPNKMSHADLEAYIAEVCPRRIDFMYLRMDFQNGCNVGYAFVNFIHVQDLLRFAQQRLGEKWNMFSSEKVLQMSYANYQGKEALVEKFKNSSIMDEREAWRPRIFYSSGPDQGKPEVFPAATHLRRKERSSHNRGALYVPGVNSGSSARRYQEDHRNQSPRRNNLYRTQAAR